MDFEGVAFANPQEAYSTIPIPARVLMARVVLACMLKAVVFDFDDTLVHSGETSYRNHCKTARLLGLPKPKFSTFLKFWGKPWHSLVLAMFPHYDMNKFIEAYSKVRLQSKYPLIHGALDTINFLHEHEIEMGILSNKPTDQLWQRIKQSALNPNIFSFVFGEQSTQYKKPDCRAFNEVMIVFRNAKIRKDEVLYVGDLTVDYFAARGAAIDFCGVLTGFHSPRKFIREGLEPWRLISSVRGLPRWLYEHEYLPPNPTFHRRQRGFFPYP